MILGGIDAGSRITKVLLWDEDRQTVLASGQVDQGVDQGGLARELFEGLLRECGGTRADVRATAQRAAWRLPRWTASPRR